MIRQRLASLAFVAGLGLLQGCSSTSSCCNESGIGHGQLLRRIGILPSNCECSTCGSGPIGIDGGSGGCQGPQLDPPGAYGPPYGPNGEPPLARPPYSPLQAQPSPSGPVSKVRVIDPGK